jgi:hypothetical protein
MEIRRTYALMLVWAEVGEEKKPLQQELKEKETVRMKAEKKAPVTTMRGPSSSSDGGM